MAIFTLWVGDQGGGGRERRLLPRHFRRDVREKIALFGCAARATTRVPVFALVANASRDETQSFCDAGASVVETSARGPPFRAVFEEEAFARRLWFNLTGVPPQRRTDGAKTVHKFLLWTLTSFETILYLDLDVLLLADPAPFLLRRREASFVAAIECGSRGYAGLNAHAFVLKPDPLVFDALVAKTEALDYLVYTNTEQDVLDAFFCPEVDNGLRLGVCAIKERLTGEPFDRTFSPKKRDTLFLGAHELADDLLPHVHDARLDFPRCQKHLSVVKTTTRASGAACACLRKDDDENEKNGSPVFASSFAKKRHYERPRRRRRRRLARFGKCQALIDNASAG